MCHFATSAATFYGTNGCAAAAPASYYLKSASTHSVGRKGNFSDLDRRHSISILSSKTC